MLQRLKDLLGGMKEWVIFIVTPLAFIVGYIAHLIAKNHALEQDLENTKINDQFKDLENEKKEIDRTAFDALAEYERERGKYLSEATSGLRQRTEGAARSNPDSGTGTESGKGSPR